MAAVFDSILAVRGLPQPAVAHHSAVQTNRCAAVRKRDENKYRLLNVVMCLCLCWRAQRSDVSRTVFLDTQDGLCGAHN